MKKRFPYAIASLAGLVYGLMTLLLSRALITHSGVFARGICAIAAVAESKAGHIVRILGQLKTADVVSPWAAVLLPGAAIGVLYYALIRRVKRKRLLSCCVWIPLLLPLSFAVILFTQVNGVRPSALFIPAPKTPVSQAETYSSDGNSWHFGFGSRQILPDESSPQPLYIAGYNSGVEITGVRDYCQARAVWLDTGEDGVLLIGIDCVGLDSGTVALIRENLSDLPNCASIHVYSTHTHAGIDTLGLWGPLAVDGKNDAYMDALIRAATQAARDAAASRAAGTLHLGQIRTPGMFRDSRDPQVFDEFLYQLRFAATDGGSGLRLFFYGAHPEALRSDNTLLSRDFPGVLCDEVTAATGDNTMFFPGAIGGLIMTKEFISPAQNAEQNLTITGNKLTAYALAITPDAEQELNPNLALSRKEFAVPMDNIAFLAYKYLGALNHKLVRAESATGYGVKTELGVLKLDTVGLALIPGEIFPELVYGVLYGSASPENTNPEPLRTIAAQYAIKQLLVVGLSNDEIGYIVPPSDFLVSEALPYLEQATDYKGDRHYEETNSLGPACATVIANAFEDVLKALQE